MTVESMMSSLPIFLNDFGPDIDEPVSTCKLNKAYWTQFESICKTRLLEEPVQESDDLDGSFTLILIKSAEKIVLKTSMKVKTLKKVWFTADCRTAVKQRKRALLQSNNIFNTI